MIHFVGRSLLCIAILSASGCARDADIGLVLIYQAKQPAAVVHLYFDEHRMLGERAGVMHLTAEGRKQLALNRPRGMVLPPKEISASWSYTSSEEEASVETDLGKSPWRQAQASVTVRPATEEERKLMRGGRHRIKLQLLFDGDLLEVHWQLESTRRRS